MMRAQDEVFESTSIAAAADRALAKLSAILPGTFTDKLSRVKALCTPVDKFSKDYSDKEDLINTLAEATIAQKVCKLKYDSFSRDEEVEFRAGPLGFFENRGGLYLFVTALDYGNIRMLAVERVVEIKETDETFERPTKFDPAELLDGAFNITLDDPVNAKIWISASQAKYVLQRKFFQKQAIETYNDGSIIMDIDTSGRLNLKQWILSLGAKARVLEPEELRQELADEVERMARDIGPVSPR